MDFILRLMNVYINRFKNIEYCVQYSKNKIIRIYGKKIIGFAALLLFTYLVTSLIYVVTLVLPEFNMLLKTLLKNLEAVYIGGTINLYIVNPSIISIIDFKQLLICYAFLLGIILSFTLLYKDREILKELHVFYSIIDSIGSNANLKTRHTWIFAIYMTLMVSLTFIFIPFRYVSNNIGSIIVFWTSLFIVMLIYGVTKDETIKAKKFIFFLIITPIIILSLIRNSTINFNEPLPILVLLISIYLAVDRIASGYVDLRKELYEGKNLFFVINSFSQNDFNKLWKKIKISPQDELIYIESPLIVGITALMKTNSDTFLAKACFEHCINNDLTKHIAMYYYAIALIKENPEEALRLLDEVDKIQEKNEQLSIRLYDINEWRVNALINMEKVDWSTIIELLENQELLGPEHKYILAISYIETGLLLKGKILLNTFYYDKDFFSDIPYYLAQVELENGENNIKKIEELINSAESLNNNCEDLKSKLKLIEKTEGC